MRNTALLEATMAQLREHPELHNQEQFFSETDCGTACCFGGWALLLSGYTPSNAAFAGALSPSGDWRGAWKSARDVLGITHAEANTLFSPANSRKALELMVEDLVNGAPLMHGGFYRDLVR